MKLLFLGMLGMLAGIAWTSGVPTLGIVIFFVLGALGLTYNG